MDLINLRFEETFCGHLLTCVCYFVGSMQLRLQLVCSICILKELYTGMQLCMFIYCFTSLQKVTMLLCQSWFSSLILVSFSACTLSPVYVCSLYIKFEILYWCIDPLSDYLIGLLVEILLSHPANQIIYSFLFWSLDIFLLSPTETSNLTMLCWMPRDTLK